MPLVTPFPESEATDRVEQTYGRIKEMLGVSEVPEVFLRCGRVPAFLQDFYMNFKKFVYSDGKLDARTKAIVGLAISAQAGQEAWAAWYAERARALGVTAEQIPEILAVAATNSMYNVFFKFRELSGSDLFSGMPVGLRAHTFTNTSLDEKTVELINIAISDLNACKPCTAGHVEKARRLGVSDETILETIQCAATVYAGVMFLKAADC